MLKLQSVLCYCGTVWKIHWRSDEKSTHFNRLPFTVGRASAIADLPFTYSCRLCLEATERDMEFHFSQTHSLLPSFCSRFSFSVHETFNKIKNMSNLILHCDTAEMARKAIKPEARNGRRISFARAIVVSSLHLIYCNFSSLAYLSPPRLSSV